jgi:hypothetical protein
MMVPGAMGINALFTLSMIDPESGLTVMVAVFMTAVQLAMAVVIANAFVPLPSAPWRSIKSLLPLKALANLRTMLGKPFHLEPSMPKVESKNKSKTRTTRFSRRQSDATSASESGSDMPTTFYTPNRRGSELSERTPLLGLYHPALSPERDHR